jgi:hypothetical protein
MPPKKGSTRELDLGTWLREHMHAQTQLLYCILHVGVKRHLFGLSLAIAIFCTNYDVKCYLPIFGYYEGAQLIIASHLLRAQQGGDP